MLQLQKVAILATIDQIADSGITMKTMSAKEAKNGFGQLIDSALVEPVTIEKHRRPVVVVLSFDEFERLRALDQLRNKNARKKADRHGTEPI